MFNVTVAAGAGIVDFVRVTHADQIDGDTATVADKLRHDVAPQVG
jgi:hypothetical protein